MAFDRFLVPAITLNFPASACAAGETESEMKHVLEIRAGEGGDDAKLLVDEFAAAYRKLFQRNG